MIRASRSVVVCAALLCCAPSREPSGDGHSGGGTLFTSTELGGTFVVELTFVADDLRCQDGRLDPGEECDPGPVGDAPTCDFDCTAVACGDGHRNDAAGEWCDLPGLADCQASCPRCGDGVVQPEKEECDAGDANGEGGCTSTCVRRRVAFTSSEFYKASALTWGDGLCTALATEAATTGTLPTKPGAPYRAWLSAPGRRATDFVRPNRGLYVNTAGEVVALSWQDLVDGNLLASIGFTENGLERYEYVWTGTHAGGVPAAETCEGWTTIDGATVGRVGHSGFASPDWTDLAHPELNPRACDTARPIYCFEE